MFSRRNVRHLGKQRQLFLDDDIIDELSGMTRRLGVVEKHPANPILKAELPWEKRWPIGANVLYSADQGYRAWYGTFLVKGEAYLPGDPRSAMSYATSSDGIKWERPPLRFVEWDGSRDNNIIMLDRGLLVIQRQDEPDPEKRYRGFGLAPNRSSYEIYHSPDGLRWSETAVPGPYRDYGILVRDSAALFWDERHQQWVSPCKLCRRVGQWPDWSIRRCVAITTSDDERTWEVPELVLAPDARDDAETAQRIATMSDRVYTNHPDEYWCDFQCMQVWPYEGLYIGLISVFDASGMAPAGNQDGLCHLQLAVSRDLRNWTRVADRQIFIGLGAKGAWDDSMILGISNAPVVLDDTIRIYYNGFAVSHMHPGYHEDPSRMPAVPGGLGLATIRRDGFVALEVGQIGSGRVTPDASGRTSAGAGEGYFRTKHFTFTGDKLYLNVDSAAHGRANGVTRVEFVEPDDTPIPGFSREECDPIKVDNVRHLVTWGGNLDVSSLQDRIVRLKFYCRTTRLYSFWFDD
jgi:hypothetical protein